jgi:predicted pyridoxine 5'-phosphate oxidase superfamily flavin-nucleotide-binding protein
MSGSFLDLALTRSVRDAQTHYYGGSVRSPSSSTPDVLGPQEIEFIETRDSFYMATVSESGWPYLQHRGGEPGFLRWVGPNALAFADYKGNRQLITTGNLAANNRVALFLIDYRRRTRLKILGHSRVVNAREHPDLLARLAALEIRGKVERLFTIDVVAFDWNCPQYITPRYTLADLEEVVAPLKAQIAALEARLATHSQS